jgi:hypothetical protein
MEEKLKLKGIIVFFVNLYPDLGQDVQISMNVVKEMSKSLIENLSQDGRYVTLFVPTHKEATRVEKVDYDSPFPRFSANSFDLVKVAPKDNLKKKANKNVFQAEEPTQVSEFKGFMSLFVNFHPEVRLDVQETINLIKTLNAESISKIVEDGQYQLIFVPTTKEASRIEKVDLESPFPRFISRNVSKRDPITKKPMNLKEKIDEDIDEDVDEEEESDGDE